ncbi:MAG: formylglycine-generating enzyme family protein [Deltaproteobacteria bacterium]|nr:formylglycine-generating enzyme family protein [Deltaproteobacteria bacterium]
MAKAEAWEAFAKTRVKGENPYADEAAANARSWRQVAALADEMRENWKKIRAALQLSVMELGKKKAVVAEFLGAYAKLGAEPELAEAAKVKRALDGGEAFPLGGGVVASGGGAGGGVASGGQAPAGYVAIPAGTFMMGSPASEDGRYDDEVQHEVRITRGFWMKQTEVTQGEWESVMGSNPSSNTSCGRKCPVENVSWFDAVLYLDKLSDNEGLERCYDSNNAFKGVRCTGYRLPTEAEWEYAARAGTSRARHGSLDQVAWYDGNSGNATHPVGQKAANAWGLYDMVGNVWEWVTDWYGNYGGAATDPAGPSSGASRVVRGGGWYNYAQNARAARRAGHVPSYRNDLIGFRPLRSIP